MKCKGEYPAPRSFHSVTAVGARVVVMGGRAHDNTHLADCHVFDTGNDLITIIGIFKILIPILEEENRVLLGYLFLHTEKCIHTLPNLKLQNYISA